MRELPSRTVTFLFTDIDDAGFGEFAWFWVRARDRRVFAIQQVPD